MLDGGPFILCGKNRHFELENVLKDLSPADTEMELGEISLAFDGKAKSSPTVHFAKNGSLKSHDVIKSVGSGEMAS